MVEKYCKALIFFKALIFCVHFILMLLIGGQGETANNVIEYKSNKLAVLFLIHISSVYREIVEIQC